jgi:hypothetical protein
VFTRALHWSLSWARSIQFLPSQPMSLRPILILSAHLRLALPSGHQPISYMHSSSSLSFYMSCPFNPAWLDHSNYTWRRVQFMKLLIIIHDKIRKLYWGILAAIYFWFLFLSMSFLKFKTEIYKTYFGCFYNGAKLCFSPQRERIRNGRSVNWECRRRKKMCLRKINSGIKEIT